MTNTAAALPPTFHDALREIFPNALIFRMYGLTECKRVSYLEPELLAEKPTSVGGRSRAPRPWCSTTTGGRSRPARPASSTCEGRT